MNRRQLLQSALALSTPAWNELAFAQSVTTLKISHQFPGGTLSVGDFRDRLCRMFAAEVEKRSRGTVKFEIYPGSSLMKTLAQFSAMRKGALDMGLIPLSYSGGELPEVNIGLMPGLVTSCEQGMSWKHKEIGKALTELLNDKGVILVSWIWHAGGMASRTTPIVKPADCKNLKIRGGSAEMDMMLKAAGASIISLPSNEIYAAMQSGAMDAALTNSTSLISFRIEEVSKSLTSARRGTYFYMFDPLMISKVVFNKLSPDQRKIVMDVGAEMEQFGLQAAKADDALVASIFEKAKLKVVDLDAATIKQWQTIARDTSWKHFAKKSERCAQFLALAEKAL